MIELIYFLFFLLVSFSLGRRLLKLFKLKIDFIEEVVFGVSLGYFILGYLTFFLGVFGLIYELIFYAIFLLGILISFFDLRYIIKNIRKIFYNFNFGFNLESTLIVILSFFIILNFVPTIAPVWTGDVTAYHFAVPKLYIKAHSIFYVPYIVASNMPFFAQMIYLMGIVLKGGVLAKLIGYSFSMILALAVISFSRRFFNLKVGLFGALIFFTIPKFMESMLSSGSDIPNALFCFLALYSFIVWFTEFDMRWLVLSAIMIGTALSIKYLAGIVFIILFMFLLIRLITLGYKRLPYKLAAIFWFSFMSFVVFLPWLIKNYFYTGNPIFPLLYSIFGGRYLSEENLLNLAKAMGILTVNLKNYISLPWTLTMYTTNFHSIMGLGPIFLAFIPLLIIVRIKQKKVMGLLLGFAFLGITMWFFSGAHALRFITFVYPVLSILSAVVITDLFFSKSKVVKLVVLMVLVSTLLFNFNLWLGMNIKHFPVVLGLESEEQFYDKLKDNNLYHASQFINQNTPSNSKIWIFKDNRGYFLDRDYIVYSPQYTTYFGDYGDEKALLESLKESGVTHILVNYHFDDDPVNRPFFTEEINNLFTDLTTKHSESIYNKNGIEIFRLK